MQSHLCVYICSPFLVPSPRVAVTFHFLFSELVSSIPSYRMDASWIMWLTAVDVKPPAEEFLAEAAKFFGAHFESYESLEGVDECDLVTMDGFPTKVPVKAFCKRALRTAEATAMAKRRTSVQPQLGLQSSQLLPMSQMSLEPLGGDASALAMARALQGGQVKEVDVNDLLAKAGLKDLPFHSTPDTAVWQILDSATKAAAPGKTFSYIELTSKEVLPLWLPADAVGGKAVLAGEMDWTIEGSGSCNTISQLHNALRSASTAPRFFRDVNQWNAAFLRYAVAAIATNQLTWSSVLGHMSVMHRLTADSKAAGHSPFLGLLYDELLRREWARRMERKDPSMDIEKDAHILDKQILDVAKSRLATVLKIAGLEGGKAQGKGHPPVALTDSLLAKQTAAAEAMQRRTEAATKAIAKQQEALLMRSQRLDYEFHQDGGGRSKGAGKSNRQQKNDSYFDKAAKQADERRHKGGGKGGFDGYDRGGGKGGGSSRPPLKRNRY